MAQANVSEMGMVAALPEKVLSGTIALFVMDCRNASARICFVVLLAHKTDTKCRGFLNNLIIDCYQLRLGSDTFPREIMPKPALPKVYQIVLHATTIVPLLIWWGTVLRYKVYPF
jgi:hypothetical protein